MIRWATGVTHSFTSFSAAAAEAEDSVVWGGIHFRFDVVTGQTLGQSVAQFVTQNFFQPFPGSVSPRSGVVPGIPGVAAFTGSTIESHKIAGIGIADAASDLAPVLVLRNATTAERQPVAPVSEHASSAAGSSTASLQSPADDGLGLAAASSQREHLHQLFSSPFRDTGMSS